VLIEAVNLSDSWTETWTGLALVPPATAFDRVVAAYQEPQRCYHTLQHLQECLQRFRESSGAEWPGEVLLALWYHDAVYDPRASDNEERSAALADLVLRRAGAADVPIARVRGLILATRHANIPGPGDAALVVDIDLAIMGADAARFAEYEDQIRAEYAWVPGPIFATTRRRVLTGFLERPVIYTTAAFRSRFEAAARANLKHALARL
jgi:predicted metal-dependent HD superfamily phosphohydrolase